MDPFEIKMDLFCFFRKIKLKHMFGGTETQGLNSSVFKKKKKRSKSNPICSNPSIQTFCRTAETEILENYKRTPCYSNISLNEKLPIQELSRDSEIIIKPVDKGGAIVLQNMDDCKKEAYRQLNDSKTSIGNPTHEFQRILEVTDMALQLNWISKSEHDFLNCTPCGSCGSCFLYVS